MFLLVDSILVARKFTCDFFRRLIFIKNSEPIFDISVYHMTTAATRLLSNMFRKRHCIVIKRRLFCNCVDNSANGEIKYKINDKIGGSCLLNTSFYETFCSSKNAVHHTISYFIKINITFLNLISDLDVNFALL